MSLLATFAVNMVLIGLGTAVWGTVLFNVPVSLPGITWHGYTFTGTHSKTDEIDVLSTSDGPFQWVVGAFYLDEDLRVI